MAALQVAGSSHPLARQLSTATEMPPLRGEIPEKRAESPPACATYHLIQSLACCQEQGRLVATVTPPFVHLVSGKSGGHTSQRAAGRARFGQDLCTASPATSIHARSCVTTSSSESRERPNAG